MGFRFRYETLLSYRRHMKEKAEVEFSLSLRRLSEARQSLESLTESRARASRLLQEDLNVRTPAYVLNNHADYVRALRHRIVLQSEEVSRCEKAVSEKKAELLKKNKACKVMEKLKERDLQKWEARQNLLERKTLDEISVTRYARENR